MKPINIAILSCNHGHARQYYSLYHSPLFNLVGVSLVKEYAKGVQIETLDKNVPIYETDEALYNAHPELEWSAPDF